MHGHLLTNCNLEYKHGCILYKQWLQLRQDYDDFSVQSSKVNCDDDHDIGEHNFDDFNNNDNEDDK